MSCSLILASTQPIHAESMHGPITVLSLLTLPFELRCHVYEILFDSVLLSPVIPDESEVDDHLAPAHIAILLTCRQIRGEALPTFWKRTTFRLRTIDHHELFSAPRMLNKIDGVERFEIDHSLLQYWPPTSLAVAVPNLKLFTISNILCDFGHSEVLQIQDGGCTFSNDGPQTESAMKLFYSLLVAQCNETKSQQIMSHCTGWQSKYSLRLNFAIRCRHIGSNVIPGPFGPRVGAPHRHDDCSVNYSFDRGD